MITYALKKRKKNGGERQRKAIYAGALLLAVFFSSVIIKMGYGWLLHTDSLTIKKINVSGCSLIDKKDVLRRSRIRKDVNILSINLGEESKRLENNPWICKAVVKRSLPDTIEIQVEERRPMAVIKLDHFYFVDNQGEIFTKVDGQAQKLPLLTGLSKEDIIKNDDKSAQLINTALSLIEDLHKKEMLKEGGTTIEMDKEFGLTMVLAPHNTKIFMGFDDFDKKLEHLFRIIDDLGKKGFSAKAINLNSVKQAYVTLKDGII